MNVPLNMPPLPPTHRQETLVASSPPIVLGRPCAVTGRTLRAGDSVVICDARPGRDPISAEGWLSVSACPHCGASTGVGLPYMPSTWTGVPTNAPPAPPPPAPPDPPARLSPALLGALAALALIALCALVAAALTYRGRTAEPTAVVQVTTTAPATAPAGQPPGPSPAPATVTPGPPTPTPVTVTPPATSTPPPTATALPPPTPNPWPLTPLVLINAETDEVIRSLHAVDTVDLNELATTRLAVVAALDASNISSVRFLLDGEPFCPREACVERARPFIMGGDQGGDAYADWDWGDMPGDHVISAIACTGDNGSGNCADPIEVRLTIVR